MNINPELLQLAQWRLNQLKKEAFVPPGGGDPSQGGPPPDPSQAGAGGPPPDPSQAGGPPPMDPSAMAGAAGPAPVPGGGGMTADTISQIVAQTMQQMGGGAAGGPGGMGGGPGGKTAKVDINTVAMDVYQVKKMLQFLFNTMGIPLPPDILDGPNRDPKTGMPMPPGTPGSTSDPTQMSQSAPGQMAQPGAPAGQGGPSGAIPPIQPMEAAGPGGAAPGGGAEKQSAEDPLLHMGRVDTSRGFDSSTISRASALAAICRRIAAN